MLYRLDPTRSELVVQLFKAGIGAVFTHNHVVQATQYTGQIQTAPTAPTTASITVEVQATALKADEPALRQQYGLRSFVPFTAKARQQTQATMESPRQLDVARFPTIRFQSTHVTQQAVGQYMITGDLTIRGVTQSVTFSARAELEDEALHSWGSFRFQQSRFGYEPYSVVFGAVRNKDEVVLHFNIVAVS